MNLHYNHVANWSKRKITLLLVALTVFAAFAGFQGVQAVSVNSSSERHIITVYDDGVEKGFITEQDNLKAALDEAGILVYENDITEPNLDEKLVAKSYSVNIYRARPVVVMDGDSRTKIMSAYKTPSQIANHAGFNVRQEDEINLIYSSNVLSYGSYETLTIDRATPVEFVFYGKTLNVYTHASTVSQFLESRGVVPQDQDTLSPGGSTPISEGLRIEIWRNGEQTLTQEEEIAFDVEKIYDANKKVGYKEVKSAGKKGKRTVTYTVVMKNGVEESREEIGSVVSVEPVTQVEIVGVQPGNGLTKSKGVNNFVDSNGITHRETYYDWPMRGVMGNCGAGGNYSVRTDGVKIDPEGFVIIAANLSNYPRCSVVETSVGQAKVYDTGGFAAVHPHGYDIATDWTNNDGI